MQLFLEGSIHDYISKDVDEFLKSLMSRGVPESIKRMVMSLTHEGKKALVDFYDEKSEFHKYADIEELAQRLMSGSWT